MLQFPSSWKSNYCDFWKVRLVVDDEKNTSESFDVIAENLKCYFQPAEELVYNTDVRSKRNVYSFFLTEDVENLMPGDHLSLKTSPETHVNFLDFKLNKHLSSSFGEKWFLILKLKRQVSPFESKINHLELTCEEQYD